MTTADRLRTLADYTEQSTGLGTKPWVHEVIDALRARAQEIDDGDSLVRAISEVAGAGFYVAMSADDWERLRSAVPPGTWDAVGEIRLRAFEIEDGGLAGSSEEQGHEQPTDGQRDGHHPEVEATDGSSTSNG